jgi:hypothetical protein
MMVHYSCIIHRCPFMIKDKVIRVALKHVLNKNYGEKPNTRIIEELGITHGVARIDIALVNGSLHGFELKSDADTLNRLPSQMKIYNLVFDKITLVVGKTHLYHSLRIVPDWWGISLAKYSKDGDIMFCEIRKGSRNPKQDVYSIAALLWRQEALNILEAMGKAKGVRAKPRRILYQRLTELLDEDVLKKKVREHLCSRKRWRVA